MPRIKGESPHEVGMVMARQPENQQCCADYQPPMPTPANGRRPGVREGAHHG